MDWLTNFIRPKIRSFVSKQDVPDNLWQKCPACEAMLFTKDFEKNLNVCYHCDHHMAISVERRLEELFDQGQYEIIELPKVPHDPLKFKDKKRYSDRLKEHQSKTGQQDALIIAKGSIGGQNVVVAAMNFAFMGGSMGAAVGAGILKGAQHAIKTKSAFITIPASGGARMQEGAISLMQMPRTVLAVKQVKDAGLPYLVILTHPTTGGVSASFAMIGDIHIAEPGATIGFAGKRVIQETIREELPEDFQTAEYLLDHGMVDCVTHRSELPEKVGLLLNLLMNKKESLKTKGQSGTDNQGSKNSSDSSGQDAAHNPEKALRSYQGHKRSQSASHPNVLHPNLGSSQAANESVNHIVTRKYQVKLAINEQQIKIDPANNNIKFGLSQTLTRTVSRDGSKADNRAAG